MSAIFNSILTTEVTLTTFLTALGVSAACGVLTALASSYKNRVSRSFFISLIVLPMVVSTVIMMVNGNVGTGVAVAGAFSLVRFRSAAGRASDITAIFLAMAAGLACAAGYVAIALLFTVIVCAVLLVLNRLPLGSDAPMELHITVPEDLEYAGAFNDLFDKYTRQCRLVKAKTSNMGSLYKLTYRVDLKDTMKMQEFIDALRCRNGNLEIAISEALEGADTL